MKFIAAAAAILFGLSIISDHVMRSSKTDIELGVRPRVGFAPLRVTAILDMKNIDEKHWCPEIVWIWSEENSDNIVEEESSEEYSCQPYNESRKEDKDRKMYIRGHTYKQPGRYELTVKLKKEGKVLTQRKVTIIVKDPMGDDLISRRH